MSIAAILVRLAERRVLLLVTVIASILAGVASGYSLSLSPFRLHHRSVEFGAASSQLLVDARVSPLASSRASVAALTARATILADALDDARVRAAIATTMRIPPDRLGIEGQTISPLPSSESAPLAPERSAQLDQRSRRYRVLFRNDPGDPTIKIATIAPTRREAIRLANAAAAAAVQSVNERRARAGIAGPGAVSLLRLGPTALGRTVNPSASTILAGLMAGFVLLLGCLLILRTQSAPPHATVPPRDVGREGSPTWP